MVAHSGVVCACVAWRGSAYHFGHSMTCLHYVVLSRPRALVAIAVKSRLLLDRVHRLVLAWKVHKLVLVSFGQFGGRLLLAGASLCSNNAANIALGSAELVTICCLFRRRTTPLIDVTALAMVVCLDQESGLHRHLRLQLTLTPL